MSNTLEFAKELIARPSVTPGRPGLPALLAARLSRRASGSSRCHSATSANLWARHGTGSRCCASPGIPTSCRPVTRRSGRRIPLRRSSAMEPLYGRGAADMKSSLAAMTDAAVEFVQRHPSHPGSIAFLITSDEEGRARDGTLKVMQALAARGEKIDWCVIGEPSCTERLGDTIRVGRRGSAERHHHRAWHRRPRRLSATGAQSDPGVRAGHHRAVCRAARPRQ